MTKTEQRNKLLNAIINSTLLYTDDVLCVTDQIEGRKDLIMYYVREYMRVMGNSDYFKLYSSAGRVFLRLNVDNTGGHIADLTTMPVGVAEKYRRKSPSFGFNVEHDRVVSDLFDSIGTAPPPSYKPMPFTLVKCDQPWVRMRVDGHISLWQLANRYPDALSDVPSVPSAVTISHVYETIEIPS